MNVPALLISIMVSCGLCGCIGSPDVPLTHEVIDRVQKLHVGMAEKDVEQILKPMTIRSLRLPRADFYVFTHPDDAYDVYLDIHFGRTRESPATILTVVPEEIHVGKDGRYRTLKIPHVRHRDFKN